MTAKYFVDTNLFVYAVDRGAGQKQVEAARVMEALKEDVLGVISTQVLQEFYAVTISKLRMDPGVVRNAMDMMCGLEVVLLDVPLIRDAIDCSILSRISFWDGLILAAARKASCDVLWTEDLNDGQVIQGVRIENPFLRAKKVRESRPAYRARRPARAGK
jgi:predicted nucleic acid-binding protein